MTFRLGEDIEKDGIFISLSLGGCDEDHLRPGVCDQPRQHCETQLKQTNKLKKNQNQTKGQRCVPVTTHLPSINKAPE